METAVYFENGKTELSTTLKILENLKKSFSMDLLTVLSDGDFQTNGIPLEPDAGTRAKQMISAGADLVLSLPVSSSLGGFGKKDFASVALIQKLHAADRVFLSCKPVNGQNIQECGDLLKACAMLIFRERPDYRKKLQELLKEQKDFRAAQTEAVVFCLPEAEELLKYRENRQTIRILDAMLQLYYLIETEFLEVPAEPDEESLSEGAKQAPWSSYRSRFEKQAAAELNLLLEKKSGQYLMEIAGSTEKMTAKLLEETEKIREYKALQQIVELLEQSAATRDTARLYLLRVLLRIRHSDMLISGLHTYVPYGHILAENPEKQKELDEIRKRSWIPLINKKDFEKTPVFEKEETFALLYEMDRKAWKFFKTRF